MNYQFEEIANAPITCWHKADCLMEAARILYDEHQRTTECVAKESPESDQYEPTVKQRQLLNQLHLPRVYMLLVGLSFENVAKGILIAKNPTLVNSNALNNDLTGPHTKLSEWLTRADVDLSDLSELDVVDRLGEAVQWAAKYPTPTRAKSMTLRPVLGGRGITEPGNFLHSDDPPMIQSIWERLCCLTHSVMDN